MSAAAERVELVARALCKSHGQDPDREIYNSVVREAKTRQWEAHLKHAWAALAAIDRLTNPAEPIPMLLFCPECHLQHIDEPDERTPEWDNPPHRSHLCHSCGTIWRPADVPTNGVAAIETQGKADTWSLAMTKGGGE